MGILRQQTGQQTCPGPQGYLLPRLNVGVGESHHLATLVGVMDMKQRLWVGGTRANHVARAKKRGP